MQMYKLCFIYRRSKLVHNDSGGLSIQEGNFMDGIVVSLTPDKSILVSGRYVTFDGSKLSFADEAGEDTLRIDNERLRSNNRTVHMAKTKLSVLPIGISDPSSSITFDGCDLSRANFLSFIDYPNYRMSYATYIRAGNGSGNDEQNGGKSKSIIYFKSSMYYGCKITLVDDYKHIVINGKYICCDDKRVYLNMEEDIRPHNAIHVEQIDKALYILRYGEIYTRIIETSSNSFMLTVTNDRKLASTATFFI